MRQETIRNRHGDVIDIEEVEGLETGYVCQFTVSEIRKQSDIFKELLDALNDDKFIFKKQYHTVWKFFHDISVGRKSEDDSLLDLL